MSGFFKHFSKPITYSKFVEEGDYTFASYLKILHNIQFISTVLNEQFKDALIKLNYETENYNREQVKAILRNMNIAKLLPESFYVKIVRKILEQVTEDEATISKKNLAKQFSTFALNPVLLMALSQVKFQAEWALSSNPEEEKEITEALKSVIEMLCNPTEDAIITCFTQAKTLSGHSSPALKAFGISCLTLTLLLIVGTGLSVAFAPAGSVLLLATLLGTFFASQVSLTAGIISLFAGTQHGLSEATTVLAEESKKELKIQEIQAQTTLASRGEEFVEEKEEVSSSSLSYSSGL